MDFKSEQVFGFVTKISYKTILPLRLTEKSSPKK